MTYDLVIRNGEVVDGSGSDAYRADVGVSGGIIVALGRISDRGHREIDAEGHVVTPGFVDGHTHMDAQVFWDPLGSSSCWHGVTSVVIGNCGFTLAPASADQRHLVVRNLERAEDIAGEAIAAGIDWTWTTFAEYLDTIDGLPKGINYAANIGHSAMRTFVMGERAFEPGCTDDDLEAMDQQLRDARYAGAIGFTTSRSHHETSDGRPVASRLAEWPEVFRMVRSMAVLGTGVFQVTGKRSDLATTDASGRDEYLDHLAELTIETGVPVVISVECSPYGVRRLEFIDKTAARGGRFVGVTHCRGIGAISSFRTSLAFDSLSEWQAVRSLPWGEQRRALSDPAVRERLVWAAYHGTYGHAVSAEPPKPNYGKMQVLSGPLPPYATVAEAAAARGVDPVELMIDLALETDFNQLFFQHTGTFDAVSARQVMKHPGTVMTFSDAGAHVSQITDASIQTHLLAHWVRDRQEFTLEEAVRMITSGPARVWGFHNRGLVREGWVADLNVFDPERIAPDMPILAHDFPAGTARFKQTATGILATIVGGEIVHLDGQHTGALPGQLLRGPLARR